MIAHVKKCSKCKEEKDMSCFNKTCRSHDGHDCYCRDCRKAINKEWQEKNVDKYRDSIKKSRTKLRIDTINAYGGKCSCCGEANIEFLTIDHVNGDGREHRAESTCAQHVYYDLKKRGYPQEGYRCLCMNCNWSIGIWGYCPHQKQSESN